MNVGEDVFEVDVQIDEAAGTQVEDPAVHDRIAVEQVTFLHARHFDDVEALFLHVQFDQAVVAQMFVFDCVQFFLMQAVHVADVAQPRIHRAKIFGQHRHFDAAAVVVAADDDVFDFQMRDGVFDGRGGIHVQTVNKVGDVAVHEHVARLKSHQLFRRDAAVGAADVEVFGILPVGEVFEVIGALLPLRFLPFAVVFKNDFV